MGEELGLVGGDVHVHRAVGLAALACQAQVERLLDVPVAPTPGDDVARQHLEQEVGPAPGGVLLVTGDHEARAHRPALGPPALAYPDATPGGVHEAAPVVGEGEVGAHGDGAEGGAQPEVFVGPVGIDDLVGVHAPGRVPDGLELTERLHELGAEHLGEELRPGLPVAVLAGEGPAVGDHEVGGVGQEGPEGGHPLGREQVEVHAGVHAPLAEVPVEHAPVAVAVKQGPEVPEVAAQPLGRHGRVLPALEGRGPAGDERGRSRPRLSYLPHLVGLDRIGEHADGGAVRAQVGDQASGFLVGFFASVAAQLDEEPAPAGREEGDSGGMEAFGLHVLDEQVVDGLQAHGSVPEHAHDVVGRGADVGVPEDDQGAGAGVGHQAQGGLEHRRARALASDQGPGHVESVLGQELVEVVARHPPRDAGVPGPDQLGVAVAEVTEVCVDVGPPPAAGDDGRELLLGCGAHGEAGAVVGQDVEALDVLVGLARHDGVDAAGVVADHPAEGAPGVGGGVGAEGELVLPGRGPEVIEDHPGLHSRPAGLAVDLQYVVQVRAEVDDDGHVGRLTGQARVRTHG